MILTSPNGMEVKANPLLGHYTNQGKAAGNRGNAAEELTASKIYSENQRIKILKTSVQFNLV